MTIKVKDVLWFCAGHGNVGIIKCHDDFDGTRYYIGQCSGLDEAGDIEHIKNWGSKFPLAAGNLLFGVTDDI